MHKVIILQESHQFGHDFSNFGRFADGCLFAVQPELPRALTSAVCRRAPIVLGAFIGRRYARIRSRGHPAAAALAPSNPLVCVLRSVG